MSTPTPAIMVRARSRSNARDDGNHGVSSNEGEEGVGGPRWLMRLMQRNDYFECNINTYNDTWVAYPEDTQGPLRRAYNLSRAIGGAPIVLSWYDANDRREKLTGYFVDFQMCRQTNNDTGRARPIRIRWSDTGWRSLA